MDKLFRFLLVSFALVGVFFTTSTAKQGDPELWTHGDIVIGIDYSTIELALVDVGSSNRTMVLQHDSESSMTNYAVAQDAIIPKNVTLKVARGAYVTVASGKYLTIKGSIEAGRYQIFSTASGYVRSGRSPGTGGGQSFVYPEWWGAVGDAVAQTSSSAASGTDDTAALQAAVNFFSPGVLSTSASDRLNTDVIGGIVSLGATQRYLIGSADLTVNRGVIIKGQLGSTPGAMLWVRRLGSSLVLDSSYTISMLQCSGLRNLCVINKDLEYREYVYTSHPSWSGTGITFEEGGYGNITGVSITECAIIGFEYGLKSIQWHTGCNIYTNLWMDNLNGIYLRGCGNVQEFSNIQMFKWATWTSAKYGGEDIAGSRSGTGIKVTYADWGALTNCFIRGYQNGYVVGTNTNNYAFTNCHSEGPLEDETMLGVIGFQVGGDFGAAAVAADASFVNCNAGSGNVGNSCGFLINATTSGKSKGKSSIIGCKAFGIKYGIYVDGSTTYEPDVVAFVGHTNSYDFREKDGTLHAGAASPIPQSWTYVDKFHNASSY